MSIEEFRTDTRAWLEANCPESLRGTTPLMALDGRTDDHKLWLQRMAERGWTAPGWPTEYGGGGLSREKLVVFAQEMRAIQAPPALLGMGTSMLGPTLLEFGTEDQKQRHLPRIVSGEIRWCQGYSEPGAGSDLASLSTRAVLDGDNFIINGQKIWTSGAQYADWMFALVRTDPNVPKHDGISFVLLDIHQPGVIVKPIRLISGTSPFCETFFDNAIARREDLVGQVNRGWTIGKRLLQYERSGQGGVGPGGGSGFKGRQPPSIAIAKLAKAYLGDEHGRISDPLARDQVIRHIQNQQALNLTQQRAREVNQSGATPAETTSIFKYYGATLSQDAAALRASLRGTRGYGWQGDAFTESELEATRAWLGSRAHTIYGGTNEIQLNIISKRVLGLPD